MVQAVPLSVRLQQIEPRLRRILQLTGTPGCSIGVCHQGEEVCKLNIGLRDVEERLPVQSDTVFLLHSLTKAFTAAAFACLVDEGKVEWTTSVKSIIPQLRDEHLTPLDLLSMRSGYWPANAFSWQGHNIVLMKKEDTIRNWNGLQQLGDFRSSYKYNNWGVALVGILVERLTGKELGHVMKERFFDPLKLKNTKMYDSIRTDNWAKSYGVLSDRSPVQIPEGSIGVGVFTEGGSGVVSTIDDMIPLYSAYLAALKHQFATGCDRTPDNPFVQCRTIFKAHTFLYPGANELLLEQSYACGWVRCQLPGSLGGIGMNSSQTTMPVVMGGGESRLCIYHQGMMPGSVSNISLIPDTETIVAVVANSSHLGDATDWISQMIIEEILEAPVRNDYERIVSDVSDRILDHLPSIGRELDKNRRHGTSPPYPLADYDGTFWNEKFTFKIDVRVKNDHLSITFNGAEIETYDLRHYEDNTWVWWMPYDESCKRGRFVHLGDANYFLMRFDGVSRLLWQTADYGSQTCVFSRA